jgi:hypothetical protein
MNKLILRMPANYIIDILKIEKFRSVLCVDWAAPGCSGESPRWGLL